MSSNVLSNVFICVVLADASDESACATSATSSGNLSRHVALYDSQNWTMSLSHTIGSVPSPVARTGAPMPMERGSRTDMPMHGQLAVLEKWLILSMSLMSSSPTASTEHAERCQYSESVPDCQGMLYETITNFIASRVRPLGCSSKIFNPFSSSLRCSTDEREQSEWISAGESE